jgi:hypothetical protein
MCTIIALPVRRAVGFRLFSLNFTKDLLTRLFIRYRLVVGWDDLVLCLAVGWDDLVLCLAVGWDDLVLARNKAVQLAAIFATSLPFQVLAYLAAFAILAIGLIYPVLTYLAASTFFASGPKPTVFTYLAASTFFALGDASVVFASAMSVRRILLAN